MSAARARSLRLVLALLPAFGSACASLRNPEAVIRYESFGSRPEDAELFDLARSSKSPEDRASHLAILKELGQRHPDNVLVHRAYQDQMVAAGERKECSREYNERALIAPSAANHYLLARLAATPESAERLLRQAIAKDNGFYWAHLALGVVLRDLGERVGAKKHLERCVEIHPDFAEGWAELADFLETESLEDAKSAWKRYATIRPHDIRGRMNLGLIFLDLGKPRDARNQFEVVLRKSPSHKEALYGTARADLDLGDPQTAAATYERILQIDPQECLAHYNLGILYEQHLQDPQRALREYEAFQSASAAREGEFLLRRVQAAKWIEDLRKVLGLPALEPAKS